MPLSRAKGNMYPWVTHCHTHLGGRCPHHCTYCYVQATAKRFGHERYQGDLFLVEHEFRVSYGKGRTIFVEHCNDLFADNVPSEWIAMIMDHCCQYPDNEYVFQTKNPIRMYDWLWTMPKSRLLGATIETSDDAIVRKFSNAPPPAYRLEHLARLHHHGERTFVTIEPILRGDMRKLANWVAGACPQFVNIGADSKGTDLDEPSAADVHFLISELDRYGIKIKQKKNLERLVTPP